MDGIARVAEQIAVVRGLRIDRTARRMKGAMVC
jgi:hypothetical protein